MEEIKELNRDSPCSLLRLNTVKMSVLPNTIYTFIAIHIFKITTSHFMAVKRLTIKVMWKYNRPRKGSESPNADFTRLQGLL